MKISTRLFFGQTTISARILLIGIPFILLGCGEEDLWEKTSLSEPISNQTPHIDLTQPSLSQNEKESIEDLNSLSPSYPPSSEETLSDKRNNVSFREIWLPLLTEGLVFSTRFLWYQITHQIHLRRLQWIYEDIASGNTPSFYMRAPTGQLIDIDGRTLQEQIRHLQEILIWILHQSNQQGPKSRKKFIQRLRLLLYEIHKEWNQIPETEKHRLNLETIIRTKLASTDLFEDKNQASQSIALLWQDHNIDYVLKSLKFLLFFSYFKEFFFDIRPHILQSLKSLNFPDPVLQSIEKIYDPYDMFENLRQIYIKTDRLIKKLLTPGTEWLHKRELYIQDPDNFQRARDYFQTIYEDLTNKGEKPLSYFIHHVETDMVLDRDNPQLLFQLLHFFENVFYQGLHEKTFSLGQDFDQLCHPDMYRTEANIHDFLIVLNIAFKQPFDHHLKQQDDWMKKILLLFLKHKPLFDEGIECYFYLKYRIFNKTHQE